MTLDDIVKEIKTRSERFRLEAIREKDPILAAQWWGNCAGLNEATLILRKLDVQP